MWSDSWKGQDDTGRGAGIGRSKGQAESGIWFWIQEMCDPSSPVSGGTE